MGAAARAPAKDGRSDHASRAPDPRVSGERGGARGAPGAGAREGSDSEIVKRRAFVKTVSRLGGWAVDRKSTRLNSSHGYISYAVFCLKKKKKRRARANQYIRTYS